jgi:hypothetical protein
VCLRAPPPFVHCMPVRTSGSELTGCLAGGRPFTHLWRKSPNARERAKSPLTRPSTMKPPAWSMRSRSAVTFGLWSRERGSATPARQRTARESPTFATVSERRVTRSETNVEPHAHAGLPQVRRSASIRRTASDSCCATYAQETYGAKAGGEAVVGGVGAAVMMRLMASSNVYTCVRTCQASSASGAASTSGPMCCSLYGS